MIRSTRKMNDPAPRAALAADRTPRRGIALSQFDDVLLASDESGKHRRGAPRTFRDAFRLGPVFAERTAQVPVLIRRLSWGEVNGYRRESSAEELEETIPVEVRVRGNNPGVMRVEIAGAAAEVEADGSFRADTTCPEGGRTCRLRFRGRLTKDGDLRLEAFHQSVCFAFGGKSKGGSAQCVEALSTVTLALG